MAIKNFKQYNESDWFKGEDFGIPRTPPKGSADRYRNIPRRIEKKIEGFEVKKLAILRRWKDNPSLQISVRKRVMSRTEKVSAREAMTLCDEAIRNLRDSKSHSGGIIVYVR
jgi:hypothetical protein